MAILQAVEDVHIREKPWLKDALHYADRSFTIIFICEMIIKMMAYGFKKYFTDAWCWLDFVIVVVRCPSGVLLLLPSHCFSPSTSFCSLSSWFTSSSTHHLFTLTTHHSLQAYDPQIFSTVQLCQTASYRTGLERDSLLVSFFCFSFFLYIFYFLVTYGRLSWTPSAS